MSPDDPFDNDDMLENAGMQDESRSSIIHYYAPSTRGFYRSDIHTTLPEDALEITADLHQLLLDGEAAGLVITPPDAEHALPYLAERPVPSLEEARAAKLTQIDAQTSAAITEGFTYEVEGQALHFSYDANDQQNFADTANASILSQMGVQGVPDSVTWNGWRIEQDEEGNEIARTLIRLTFTAASFLQLYTGGALVHKATQMEIGGQRKTAVEAATSLEELEAL